MRRRPQRHREPWWTRERVLEGMRRFYRDFKFAATSTEEWQDNVQFTGSNRNGVGNPYPSFYGVLKYFKTFRQAWTAAGIKVNRDWEEWTKEEDAFITENAGILTRRQIAEALDRTQNAVHRRLYDLGINTRSHHGWTIHRVSTVTGIPNHILRRYVDQGLLPYFRGCRYIYLDPIDLMIVSEIDWDNPPAELEEAVDQALASRSEKASRGEDWRATRRFIAHRTQSTNKTHQRKRTSPARSTCDLKIGQPVQIQGEQIEPDLNGRMGIVKEVYYSRYGEMSSVKDRKKSAWMARVEFKRTATSNRFFRTLPVDVLNKEVSL